MSAISDSGKPRCLRRSDSIVENAIHYCGKWECWERSWAARLIPPLLQSVPAMVFDSMSFCKFVNEKGRDYQYRAMELIRRCREFSVASEQSPEQVDRLQRYLPWVMSDSYLTFL